MEATKKRGRKIKNIIDLSVMYPIKEDDDELTKARKELVQGYKKTSKSKQDKVSAKSFEKLMKDEKKTILSPQQFRDAGDLVELGFKISYITNDKPPKVRYGGYLKSKNLDDGYIVLKGMFNISFSVQLSNVKKFFISDPKSEPKKVTKHGLYINDEFIKDFNKASDAKKYIQTKKFLKEHAEDTVELRKVIETVEPEGDSQ